MPAQLTTREAFLESVLHDEHIILGRKMLPFCFEMWCILDALDSPLLTSEPNTIEAMQVATIACSTPSLSDFYRLTRNPSLRQSWWKAQTSINYPDVVMSQFNRYVEDYVPLFPRWDNVDGGYTRSHKSPEIFLIAAQLIDRGHSKHEVYRGFTVGEMIAWKLAMDESKGDPLDSIMGDEAASQMQEAGLL